MSTSYAMVGAIVLFGGAGWLLDRTLATAPWLLVAGLALGVIIGFAVLYQAVRHG